MSKAEPSKPYIGPTTGPTPWDCETSHADLSKGYEVTLGFGKSQRYNMDGRCASFYTLRLQWAVMDEVEVRRTCNGLTIASLGNELPPILIWDEYN